MSDIQLVQLKQDDKVIYPLTQYNQVFLPDGSRWDGTLGSKDVFIGYKEETPQDEEPLWIYLDDRYTMDEDNGNIALKVNAIKYVNFSISNWEYDEKLQKYISTITGLKDITKRSCVLNFVLDEDSQLNQLSYIHWKIIENGTLLLSTQIQPAGPLTGYMILCSESEALQYGYN